MTSTHELLVSGQKKLRLFLADTGECVSWWLKNSFEMDLAKHSSKCFSQLKSSEAMIKNPMMSDTRTTTPRTSNIFVVFQTEEIVFDVSSLALRFLWPNRNSHI